MFVVWQCARPPPCCFFLVLTPDGASQREFFYRLFPRYAPSQRHSPYTTKPLRMAASVCRLK